MSKIRTGKVSGGNISDLAFKAIENSDNLTLQGISEVRNKSIHISRLSRPGLRVMKSIGKRFTARTTGNKMIRTAKPKKVKDCALKGIRDSAINSLRVQRESTTDTTIAAVHTVRDYSSQIRTGVKAGIKTGKNAVNTTKTTYKAAKKVTQITSTVARRVLTNPIVLNGLVIAAIVLLLISVINSSITIITLPLYAFMADESTLLNYKSEVERLDSNFASQINQLKAKAGYDDHLVRYMNDEGVLNTNWKEILAIIAVKFEQNLNLSEEEKQYLEMLFNSMNKITTQDETYEVPELQTVPIKVTDEYGIVHDSTIITTVFVNKKRLVVEVYTYGFEDVIDNLGFNEDQKTWARTLCLSDLSAMFPGIGLSDERLTPEEIQARIANEPQVNVTREEMIDKAKSLVGKVGYFWGGKSGPGWNSLWGKPMLVTAEGSKNTGTYQPYGLDCSGYVDWVYMSAGIGNMLAGGTTDQWDNSYPISEGDLRPGDLVFKSSPSTSGINHVGIYLGRDTAGKKLYLNCAADVGVVIDSYSGFKYWRRPFVKFKGE